MRWNCRGWLASAGGINRTYLQASGEIVVAGKNPCSRAEFLDMACAAKVEASVLLPVFEPFKKRVLFPFTIAPVFEKVTEPAPEESSVLFPVRVNSLSVVADVAPRY